MSAPRVCLIDIFNLFVAYLFDHLSSKDAFINEPFLRNSTLPVLNVQLGARSSRTEPVLLEPPYTSYRLHVSLDMCGFPQPRYVF